MSVQRRRFQAVKGVIVGMKFHIFYLFKAEEIIRIDRSNNFFAWFKITF